MTASDDLRSLMALFATVPSERQLDALWQFLVMWEKTCAAKGFPYPERLYLVREHISPNAGAG